MSSVSQYRTCLAYLVVPNRAYSIFILGLVLATTAVSIYLYLRGAERALQAGWFFLTACFSVGLFVLPFRMRQLLMSRAFVLSSVGPRVLIASGAFICLLWALCVAIAVYSVEGLSIVAVILVFWGTGSLLIAGATVVPAAFLLAFSLLMFLPSLLPASVSLAPLAQSFELWLGCVIGLLLALACWASLHRYVQNHPLAPSELSLEVKSSHGPFFTWFANVRLSGSDFDNFLKVVQNSGRPVLTFVVGSGLACVMWVIGGSMLSWLRGGEFLFWLEFDNESGMFYLGFLFIPAAMALTVGQSILRKTRTLWLILPGDRKRQMKYVERAFGVFLASAFTPLVLLALLAGAWGLVPVDKTAALITGATAFSILLFYWIMFIYGRDESWIGIVNLLAAPALIGIVGGIAGAHTGSWLWMYLLAAVIVGLVLIIRIKLYARWERIDYTQLLTARLF
ncbi:hypothetical protein QWI17_02470 [Gilvimarinus sp. SDUM040013]|uniref:ABC-2 type transport system permease protein n=1 Tax=Gilvimarinus gilvus TaxID=3058038 RepID=A0ABU4S115_9GAMM|nr:hypothetical protein [Gilvimarinus sp. SDUM040013]MDO3384697.1 hypothetical protein [Gilvimarinus sp. SDUM040013]MDX6850828.1 hypothetical protein [Gilvimarinus sp. SDUM040013]